MKAIKKPIKPFLSIYACAHTMLHVIILEVPCGASGVSARVGYRSGDAPAPELNRILLGSYLGSSSAAGVSMTVGESQVDSPVPEKLTSTQVVHP